MTADLRVDGSFGGVGIIKVEGRASRGFFKIAAYSQNAVTPAFHIEPAQGEPGKICVCGILVIGFGGSLEGLGLDNGADHGFYGPAGLHEMGGKPVQ